MEKDDSVLKAQFMEDVGWPEFIQGDWTLEPPTTPGLYPVADPIGCEAGHVMVVLLGGHVIYYREGSKSARASDVWTSWWWSAPQPPLPPAPLIPIKE